MSKELIKKYGLSDEQIEAMGGLWTNMPRPILWRFRKHTPDEIRDLTEIFAENVIKETRVLVEALNKQKTNPELLESVNHDLIRIMRNAERKDRVIERELKNPSPEFPHPYSSI